MSENYQAHRQLYANAAGDKATEMDAMEKRRQMWKERYDQTNWDRVDAFHRTVERLLFPVVLFTVVVAASLIIYAIATLIKS